jgi:hypothetical protein
MPHPGVLRNGVCNKFSRKKQGNGVILRTDHELIVAAVAAMLVFIMMLVVMIALVRHL